MERPSAPFSPKTDGAEGYLTGKAKKFEKIFPEPVANLVFLRPL
jgi:hypothetical protein